ncbi:MAG: hypothetical protein AAF423_11535 [Pseudomonadota bacterium]
MADYYSILSRTIERLANNTPEMRQSVYSKARTAIESQLRRLDPPPGEEAIAAQLKLLEEAILVIDSEYAPAPAQASTHEPAVQEPAKAADGQTGAVADPAPVTQNAIPQPAVETTVSNEHSASDPSVIQAEGLEPIASEANVGTVDAVEAASLQEPPTVKHIAPAPETLTSSADSVAPEPMLDQGGNGGTLPPLDSEIEPSASSAAHLENIQGKRKKRSSGIFRFVTILIVLALLGGAGYGIWLNRTVLQPLVASMLDSISGSGSSPKEQAEVEVDKEVASSDEVREVRIAEDNSEKEPVRLGADGQDEVAEPTVAGQVSEQTTDTPVVIEQPEIPSETNQDQPAVEPVQEEQAAQDDSNQPPEPVSANALGEVAYLYEEGGAGSGATRTSATVNWSIVRVKPNDTLPPEPVIVGKMDVPEKGLVIDLTIKRNADAALAASHIIDLAFDIPDGFSGGSIDNIARFVLKPTEEARGEPLDALAAKVSDGYFLIALGNLNQAVERNVQLLVNSSWIDIPISYSTGKRALLTLEKGGSGEQVFKEAFEDWQSR